MAVGTGLPRCTGGADASIVDKDIQPVVVLPYNLGQAAHLGQRCEIRDQTVHATAGCPDVGNDALATGTVAAMRQHMSAGGAQAGRHYPADTVRGSGDQRNLAIQSSHNVLLCGLVRLPVSGDRVAT